MRHSQFLQAVNFAGRHVHQHFIVAATGVLHVMG
jgi:hypothetical protein